MVVMRGINDLEIESMLDFALERSLDLRFIETMPVGTAGADNIERYVPADVILDRVRAHCGTDLIPAKGARGAGPARYYQIGAGPMRVGVITALSRHFCDGCNRVRLKATGDLVLCLGREDTVPLGGALRSGVADSGLKQMIRAAILSKPARHSFDDAGAAGAHPMSRLGG